MADLGYKGHVASYYAFVGAFEGWEDFMKHFVGVFGKNKIFGEKCAFKKTGSVFIEIYNIAIWQFVPQITL